MICSLRLKLFFKLFRALLLTNLRLVVLQHELDMLLKWALMLFWRSASLVRCDFLTARISLSQLFYKLLADFDVDTRLLISLHLAGVHLTGC